MVIERFMEAVRLKHPQLHPGVDYYFELDEHGATVLGKWPAELALPTDAELVQAEHRLAVARIAARRYAAEIAGVTVAGLRINTDDRSKLLINGAAVEAMMDPAYVLRWKVEGVFVGLDAEQVKTVARAVRAYVQACFDREEDLLAELNNGTFTDSMLEQGWP